MLTIISRRERKTRVSYSRQYDWQGETNWGFGFPCDEQGNVDVSQLMSPGLENYRACADGTMRGEDGRGVVDRGVQRYEHSYVEPAIGRCACGRTVVLYDSDVDCDCGRIYNMVGQELAPRSQWEEDGDGDFYGESY